nr:cyclin-dependent protein kinase inhibitor SMR2-like [Coffea arabica]
MSEAHAVEESSSKNLSEEDEKKPKKSGTNHEEDQCKTPVSQDQKIPAPQTCPPAPKKPKRRGISRKRKLSKLQFFEKTGQEEVESFFQSSSSEMSSTTSSHVAPETATETQNK